MMAGGVQAVIDRLDGAKQTGPGRYLARCPAHEDRSPSLTVRELDDGRILVHCFSGCGAADVMHAIGLTMSDLFPEEQRREYKPVRPGERWIPRDVLAAVAHEALLVAMAAERVASGSPLPSHDAERTMLAAKRLRTAAEEVGCA